MTALQTLPSAGAAAAWLRQRGARALASDSRQVRPGDGFIAWPGLANDARRFVGPALAAGASACLVEAEGAAAFGFGDDRVAALRGLKAAAGSVASEFLGAPSRRLDVLAVTGTNGKTSTAWWLAQALSLLGRRCGVVGTLGIGEPPRLGAAGGEPPAVLSTGLTTPDPIALQTAFGAMADRGFAACAIEASSIGLEQQRLAGTAIKVALFTNFTRDHLDQHGTMEAYWQAKSVLFDWPGLRAAVVNVDDERGAVLAAQLAARPSLDVWTCSVGGPARLAARAVNYRAGGLCFEVSEGAITLPVRSALIGEFNVANLLGVIGGLRALGVPLADAITVCARLSPVPGRMQRIESFAGAPEVVVDYAHTPDALEKALIALRPFARERGGRLWCVFGCGGNRDATKRPLMGAIAERLADHVVVTSDNPRNEAPGFIMSQILVGVIGHDDVDVMEDRAEAIGHAVRSAAAPDVVLIAGKGHEDYQEIEGIKRPFSDIDTARACLHSRSAGGGA